MPRKILTQDERIERHVSRFNAKEIGKMPLFSDQIPELLERGIIRSKTVQEANAAFGANVIREKFERMDKESFEQGNRCIALILEQGRHDIFEERMAYWERVFEKHGKPKTTYWCSTWYQAVEKNFGKLEALTLLYNDRGRAEKEMADWKWIHANVAAARERFFASTPPVLFDGWTVEHG
jgi:hypothetical protein